MTNITSPRTHLAGTFQLEAQCIYSSDIMFTSQTPNFTPPPSSSLLVVKNNERALTMPEEGSPKSVQSRQLGLSYHTVTSTPSPRCGQAAVSQSGAAMDPLPL